MADKVIEQLEYYFGNINLPRDKFLQEKLKEDDGWVTLETMLKFNRLASITTDTNVIADAVKNANSDIVTINEDGTKIRRNDSNPLPENSLEYWQTIKHRTVYMKGFNQDTSLDSIREWAKKYGHVDNVLMRRTKPDRVFKGSVFITYKTREEAESAQKSEDKFGGDTELFKLMQDDYWAQKNRETKEKRANEKAMKSSKNAKDSKDVKNAPVVSFVKGLILEVSGLPKDIKFAEIKEFLAKYGEVAYAVLDENNPEVAQIRFSGAENNAQKAWDTAVAAAEDGKPKIGENELTAKVLEGDQEAAYWEKFNESRKQRQQQSKRGRGNNRRGGRGGHGGRSSDRKRGHDDDAKDEPAVKGKRTVFADEGEGDMKKERFSPKNVAE
ncbi:unnamed protein product, partial [Mesorhabditis belari]|uniref:Uncharacterized protein n=1 Tax=Mesorhabditis belari TaxID=2138241 RepID=A0AAF3J607_9BILA